MHSARIARLAERRAIRWQQQGDQAPFDELVARATQIEVSRRKRQHQQSQRVRQIAADLRRADAVSSDGAILALARRMAKEKDA